MAESNGLELAPDDLLDSASKGGIESVSSPTERVGSESLERDSSASASPLSNV
jgi:hypothetical protein